MLSSSRAAIPSREISFPAFAPVGMDSPIENPSGMGWVLESRLLDEWAVLESSLRVVLQVLYDVYRSLFGPGLSEGMIDHMPETYNVWPKRYGYNMFFHSWHEAKSVAARAQNAFIPLMATITMMIVLFEGRSSLGGQASDWWRLKFLEKLKEHPRWEAAEKEYPNCSQVWFSMLEASAIGDLSIPRVGGILDFTCPHNRYNMNLNSSSRRHKLEGLVNIIYGVYPIPLYFFWGNLDAEPDFPIPRRLKDLGFYPEHREIACLSRLPGKVAFSAWIQKRERKMHSERDDHPYRPPHISDRAVISADTQPPQIPDRAITSADAQPPQILDGAVNSVDAQSPVAFSSGDALAARYPQPEKDSGQMYGEDVQSFMARRRVENEKLAARETPGLKSKRLEREREAAKGTPPGRKGARVFIWEEEDGFFIRRAFNRISAADRWDEFTTDQRVCDGFHHEWNLCTAFAPDEEPSDDDCGADDEFPQLPGILDELYSEESIGKLPTASDILRSHDLELNDDLEPGGNSR
ncbi:hypothetical protein MVEN_00914700 [Mycena venus]|uniref:Uncharacterized protein n=1 Tax=Mycena venus TaxID=2733690 RepID=A0A8H6YBV5_9AGAR|nr:hypothetical protein MVEN_00914700 [Mycena venus]